MRHDSADGARRRRAGPTTIPKPVCRARYPPHCVRRLQGLQLQPAARRPESRATAPTGSMRVHRTGSGHRLRLLRHASPTDDRAHARGVGHRRHQRDNSYAHGVSHDARRCSIRGNRSRSTSAGSCSPPTTDMNGSGGPEVDIYDISGDCRTPQLSGEHCRSERPMTAGTVAHGRRPRRHVGARRAHLLRRQSSANAHVLRGRHRRTPTKPEADHELGMAPVIANVARPLDQRRRHARYFVSLGIYAQRRISRRPERPRDERHSDLRHQRHPDAQGESQMQG